MPIKWDEKSMYILACKVIEQNPNALSTINFDKLSKTWPCEDTNDRPGVPTLKKQMTKLRKDANLTASSVPTPRSTPKPTNSNRPKTPIKRTAPPLPKTPVSKKRESTSVQKRKADSDDDMDNEITSSDEDPNVDETASEIDDASEKTPMVSNRRVLPARSRRGTAKSYTIDSDSESKDAGARSDSDDELFDPNQGKDDTKVDSPKIAGLVVRPQSNDIDYCQQDYRSEGEDDSRSVATSTHTGWKSAQEDLDDNSDDDEY